jgi:hypothetical protein
MPFGIKIVITKSLKIYRFVVETTITIDELKARILAKLEGSERV